MFLHVSVILFTGRSARLHPGIHTYPHPGPEAGTPREQTPPMSRPPGSRPPVADPPGPGTPRDQTPLEPGTPPGSRPPSTVHAWRYRQEAGGMIITGMQSCLMMKMKSQDKNHY